MESLCLIAAIDFLLQAFSSVVMRLSRPRMVPVPPLCPWLSLVSGTVRPFLYLEVALLTSYSFAEAVIKAAKGEKGIVEPTFVYLPGVPGGDEIAKATGVDFFSTPVELGVS
jgi:hypothetical protein